MLKKDYSHNISKMKRKCKKNVLRIDKSQQKTSVPSQNTDERSMNEKKAENG